MKAITGDGWLVLRDRQVVRSYNDESDKTSTLPKVGQRESSMGHGHLLSIAGNSQRSKD